MITRTVAEDSVYGKSYSKKQKKTESVLPKLVVNARCRAVKKTVKF